MAYDLAGLPDGLIIEQFEDIVEEETAFADTVCRRVTNKTALKGNAAVRGGGIARGENQNLAPLEAAKSFQYANTTFEYDARAFVGSGVMSKEEVMNEDAFFSDSSEGNGLTNARRDANTALDRHFASILLSTSLNEEFDVPNDGAGEYDDGGTTSTLATDLRYMRELSAPGSDTIVIGRNVRNALLLHSDLIATAQASGGAGNNVVAGTTDMDVLEAWLKRVMGFKNVFVFEKLYESSAVNGTSVAKYIFDNNMWIGYADDLICVHPAHALQDSLVAYPDHDIRAIKFQHDRYDSINRPTKRKGVIATTCLANPTT